MMAIRFEEVRDSTKVYRIGDTFLHRRTKEAYILTGTSEEKCMLVCLNDGMRYADEVGVADRNIITSEEFARICGKDDGDFVVCDFVLRGVE